MNIFVLSQSYPFPTILLFSRLVFFAGTKYHYLRMRIIFNSASTEKRKRMVATDMICLDLLQQKKKHQAIYHVVRLVQQSVEILHHSERHDHAKILPINRPRSYLKAYKFVWHDSVIDAY